MQWSKEKGTKGQNIIYKILQRTRDRVTRVPLKPGVNSGAPEGNYWYHCSILDTVDTCAITCKNLIQLQLYMKKCWVVKFMTVLTFLLSNFE
jgi:hypothetical protein